MSRNVENERSKSRHLDKYDLKIQNGTLFLKMPAFLRVLMCAVPYGNTIQNIRLKEMVFNSFLNAI